MEWYGYVMLLNQERKKDNAFYFRLFLVICTLLELEPRYSTEIVL